MDMSETIGAIVVACITLIGNAIGIYFSTKATHNIVAYRVGELEKKVEKHNNLIERTYCLEREVSVLKEHIETVEQAERS